MPEGPAAWLFEFGTGFLSPETCAPKGSLKTMSPRRDRKSETTARERWPQLLLALSCRRSGSPRALSRSVCPIRVWNGIFADLRRFRSTMANQSERVFWPSLRLTPTMTYRHGLHTSFFSPSIGERGQAMHWFEPSSIKRDNEDFRGSTSTPPA